MGKTAAEGSAPAATQKIDRRSMDLVPASVRMNTSYGSGVFRRRVRLENRPGTVCAELEDCKHGFRLHLGHDGKQVTAMAAEGLRVPMATCLESGGSLKELIGAPLTIGWAEFQERMPASAHCTYLRDMAWWSLAHAQRTEPVRDYEIAVTDAEAGQPHQCSLWRNGELVFCWDVVEDVVVAPPEFANRPLMLGFSGWAKQAFQGEAFEAAVMLQRGYFVSRGRRVDGNTLAGVRAVDFKHMHGACYSYSPPAVERAVFLPDTDRDFTHTRELLLKFK